MIGRLVIVLALLGLVAGLPYVLSPPRANTLCEGAGRGKAVNTIHCGGVAR